MKLIQLSLLIKGLLIEMFVFLMISFDFVSFSYECECILNMFLKKMIDILMFCHHSKAFSYETD